MPIRVQPTPNPNARKYILPAQQFGETHNYGSVVAAAAHPLAARLFALDGVYNVMLAQDFVTVNKRAEATWEPLESAVLDVLSAYWAETSREQEG
jgi:hypothetical protein